MVVDKNIVVVEDEEHLSYSIKFNLEEEGYRVTTASDGSAALRVIRDSKQQVDLVILDIMLPGMSGYKVCEALRDEGNHVPVLLLSARTLPEDRSRGFDVGANQYLSKPFELDELLSRVKNLLLLNNRQTGQRSLSAIEHETIEFGETVVNFTTHEVFVRGVPTRLTKLELDLLKYFVENEGRVISRDELLVEVWRMPGTLTTRAPDQFIRRLRKNLEPDPSNPCYFLTVREAGYRFVSG